MKLAILPLLLFIVFLYVVPKIATKQPQEPVSKHESTNKIDVASKSGEIREAVDDQRTPVFSDSRDIVVSLIVVWFGPHSRTAVAIGLAESSLRPEAKGWNCMYNGVSRACKTEDRANAYSVDCGVFQINIKGQECPQELLNPETNVKRAYEMFQRRGFQPWVAYNSKRYLSFL